MAPSTLILKPTQGKGRIPSIDILRGLAVLGILIMNIQSFSMPSSAYFNPTSFERLSGSDLSVWLLSHVFANQKFMAIFSMLFGASIIMLSTKAKKENVRSTNLQYRRFFFLAIIGLLHAYLLWAGDILFPYAICGFLLFSFRGKRSLTLLKAGIVFLAVGSLISLFIGYSVPFWEPGEYQQNMAEVWSPSNQQHSEEIDYYTSHWERQMIRRIPDAYGMQTTVFLFDSFWRIAGCMLIGMFLFKRQAFQAKQSKKFYFRLIGIGWGIGLPIIVIGTLLDFHFDWNYKLSFYFFSQFNYWGSVLLALGYIGILMLICKSGTQSFLAKRLGNIGQMALTNYLMQSIICTYLFYGHGLGLFGGLDRSMQAITVLIIWAFQFLFSWLWLSYFAIGPFEWLWRSLTYAKIQRIGKGN